MSFAAVLERLAKLANPYPGLRPFETSESHLFFGRDQQVLDLCDRLSRHRFVAVLGLSGSGKSSLVRAGLIPALQRGRLLEPGRTWRIAQIRPSGAPFANLAAALGCRPTQLLSSSHGLIEIANKEEPLLVLIDQFEELFRYKDHATGDAATSSEAAAFISLLLASARSPLPIYIVITMRTDYLGDCAEFPEFPEALNESQYLVPRLTREQRRQAIEGPLGRVPISSALVEQILNDAGDEPDQLPILQHALMRTWSYWRNQTPENNRAINATDYLAIGGFSSALNQHADQLLATLADPEFAEIVFKRLTALGRGNRERRDPARLSELWELCNAESPEKRRRVNAVIDIFRQGDATFLAPRDGELTPATYIDIAHESLSRNWQLLAKTWLPEEEKQAKTLIELLDRARGWQSRTRDLLVGLDLSSALEWKSQINPSPKWAEHYAGPGALAEVESFLSASHRKFEDDQQREHERHERELSIERKLRQIAVRKEELALSSARRTKIFSFVLAALLLGAVALAYIAWKQKKLAESRELAAQAETLFSLGKRGEALTTAIQAFSVEKTSQAREAIAHAFPQKLVELEGHSGQVFSAAFSPDGQRIVTASDDKTARLWNAATGEIIAKLEGHSARVNSAAFSPDGQRAATASDDHTARIWNPTSGHLIAKLVGHSAQVWSAEFSPDGQRIVTASNDGTGRVWNATTGDLIAKLEGHSGAIFTAVFSPGGQRIATASHDQTARTWNAANGRLIATLVGHSGEVSWASFSPDGQRVITASADGTGRTWNADNGQFITKLPGNFQGARIMAFSPDWQRAAISSGKIARIWNANSGGVIATLADHLGPVLNAAFSPDGQRVVTASTDNTARVWNASTGKLIANLQGHSNVLYGPAFSPDSRLVATASADGTARVWNAATGALIAQLDNNSGLITSAAFSPDGHRIVTASTDGTALIWRIVTLDEIARLLASK